MEIVVINKTKGRIRKKHLISLLSFSTKKLKIKGEVSLVFIGSKEMKSLNKKWRNKDKTTDVLSFLISQEKKEISGDIFIDLNECSNIEPYKQIYAKIENRDQVIDFLAIHGLLHLAGYSDDSEVNRKKMINQGIKLILEYENI